VIVLEKIKNVNINDSKSVETALADKKTPS